MLPNDVRSFQWAIRVNSELRLVVMSRLLSLGDKIDKGHQDSRRSPPFVSSISICGVEKAKSHDCRLPSLYVPQITSQRRSDNGTPDFCLLMPKD